jgi:hypothetical protein
VSSLHGIEAMATSRIHRAGDALARQLIRVPSHEGAGLQQRARDTTRDHQLAVFSSFDSQTKDQKRGLVQGAGL